MTETRFPEPTLPKILRKAADGRQLTPEEAWDVRLLSDWLAREYVLGIDDLDHVSEALNEWVPAEAEDEES